MDQNKEKKISKTLSYVLRHKPEELGIELDASGWTSTQVLLEQLSKRGDAISMNDLRFVVANNNKKRFSFNEDESKIRANQGHSVVIDLQLQELEPPEILYHGTATRYVDAITQRGLLKMNRHHVHLSSDKDTAQNVGQRHGKPIVYEVKALQMHQHGHRFFLSENGVWLTDHVPNQYLD